LSLCHDVCPASTVLSRSVGSIRKFDKVDRWTLTEPPYQAIATSTIWCTLKIRDARLHPHLNP
jgi:hypothetical protein